ncbi:MAG: enoyl-CoA hydratase/isomerase family protein, partial [Chloroflexi bacterium]|nr:enoyl-CoA hydratase/isomerase family protein [Chloroflexota bacterium]
NALDFETFHDLYESLWECDHDDSIRVVVLTGEGPVFSAGQNLKGTGRTPDEKARYGEINERTREYITRMTKPVIARLQGPALGGGMYVATCCDIIVAADDAWLQMVEIRVASHSGGAHLWTIGLQRAREINLLGRRIPASEAYEIGLINRVVPRDQLDAAVKGYVDEILQLPPLSVKASKQAMRIAMDATGYTAWWQGIKATHYLLFGRDDAAEARQAFAQKRPPTFRGQ